MNRSANHISRHKPAKYTVFSTYLAGLALVVIVTWAHHESPGDESDDQAATSVSRAGAESAMFKEAGTCARCHVFSVLEWAVSRHLEVATNCQSCHGESKGHVANERNEVKPEYLYEGQAIAGQLCMTCHGTGCPDTNRVDNCQQCHHVHALMNPAKPLPDRGEQLEKLLHRWDRFDTQIARGKEHADQQQWEAAGAAFQAALKLIPGDAGARAQLAMCQRRLQTALAGFERLDDAYDKTTGLPRAVKVPVIDMPMRLVPPGEFDMGSDRWADARPVHTVRIDAFFLGAYEVTQAQWLTVMGNNPAGHQGKQFPNSQRMPVEHVSWQDCQAFIRRLNERVPGGGFRLPTEAEWEYACRGPRAAAPGANDIAELAWFGANSRRPGVPEKPDLDLKAYAPRTVGTRRAGNWDLYDMHGNVREWCSSLWRPYLYNPADGREALTHAGLRVLRGGAYCDAAASLDPALRHAERPNRRLRFNGLRLARNVPQLKLPDLRD